MASCSIIIAMLWTNRVLALTHCGLLAIWRRRSWSLLVQEMASCLATPSCRLSTGHLHALWVSSDWYGDSHYKDKDDLINLYNGKSIPGKRSLHWNGEKHSWRVESLIFHNNSVCRKRLQHLWPQNGITTVTLRGHVKSTWKSKTYIDIRGLWRQEQVSLAWMCNYIFCGV